MPGDSIMFDVWSATYDRPGFQLSTYRPVHDAILDRLDREGVGPEAGGVIVDLGCGTGRLTARLVERWPDAHVVGVDLSEAMLGHADDRVLTQEGNASLVLADATHLPFAAGSVDVVVCTESFHWYPDQPGTLAQLHALLNPGGHLLIASIATLTGLGDEALRRASRLAGQQIQALPKRTMRKLLTNAGFEVLEQRRVVRFGLVPWPVLSVAVRS